MGQEDVNSMIRSLGFYDSERNKIGIGIERRDYEIVRRENLIIDNATGLMWQRSGLSKANYAKAQNYIRKINNEHFCGYNDWRLPTLEEAMSLLKKSSESESRIFIDSQFDELWWVWTADKSDPEIAWIVDYDLGSCRTAHIIEIDYFYVRPVRTHSVNPRKKLRSEPLDNLREEVATPMSLADSIQRFKEDHDPKKTVFVMMKYFGKGDSAKDAKLQTLYKVINEELNNYRIHAVKAEDNPYEKDLWNNIKVYANGCNYGIAVLENLHSDIINPNVALEYGFMIAKVQDELRVLLLKEKSFNNIQADLLGKVWEEFDIDDEESIKIAIRNWMKSLQINRIGRY